MKAFRFRAAVLLQLRRHKRDHAQAELARARHAERDASAATARADALQREAARLYREAMHAGSDAGSLERHRNWITLLGNELGARRRTESERTQVAARLADMLATAHRDVRVLERLQDRARRRYDEQVRRQEMKDIDEIATLRHARRFAEGGSEREC